jgi:hypothetical protein
MKVRPLSEEDISPLVKVFVFETKGRGTGKANFVAVQVMMTYVWYRYIYSQS